jgi:hypothetical protein
LQQRCDVLAAGQPWTQRHRLTQEALARGQRFAHRWHDAIRLREALELVSQVVGQALLPLRERELVVVAVAQVAPGGVGVEVQHPQSLGDALLHEQVVARLRLREQALAVRQRLAQQARIGHRRQHPRADLQPGVHRHVARAPGVGFVGQRRAALQRLGGGHDEPLPAQGPVSLARAQQPVGVQAERLYVEQRQHVADRGRAGLLQCQRG